MAETTEIKKDVMRWVVGLDLRPHSHGAINFASWLHEHDRGGELGHELIIEGLHLVDSAVLELPDTPSRTEILGNAKRAALAALVARKAAEAFAHVDAVEARDLVDTLAAAGALAHTTGVIVGRRAKGEDLALVRLGRVARRLLRRLDSPVFVVPPDLEREHIGPGPIVCAVTLDDQGVEVARFGERLGRAIGRGTRLVHVHDPGSPIGIEYLPEGTWDNYHHRQAEERAGALARWRDANDLQAKVVTAHGQTVPKLITSARELDACMILCGSRRLSLAQRMWTSSIGSTLAAAAHLPVGVIPTTTRAGQDEDEDEAE